MSKSLGTGIDPLDLIDGGPRPPVFTAGRRLPRLRRRRGALRPAGDVLHPGRALQRGEDRAGPAAGQQALQRRRASCSLQGRRRGDRAAPRPTTVEDRWILSRLQALEADADGPLDGFDFAKAALGPLRLRLRRALRLVPRARQAAPRRVDDDRSRSARRCCTSCARRSRWPTRDPVRDRGAVVDAPGHRRQPARRRSLPGPTTALRDPDAEAGVGRAIAASRRCAPGATRPA